MKEFILADSNRNDIAVLSNNCSIDVDIGDTNDFQLVIPLDEYDSDIHKAGNILYCLGTEYGGVLNDPEVNTKNGTVTFKGDTPRGMLNKKIIEPPSGSDYRTFLNIPVGILMNTMLVLYPMGALIHATFNTSTATIVRGQFDRYCKLFDGVEKVLNSYHYKSEIKAIYDANNKIQWQIEAVPVEDYTEQIEISQDCNVDFVIRQKTNKYTHIICGGQGELKDRTIVHLYLQSDGSVGTNQYYTDKDDVVYFYDYSSAESIEELTKAGKEQLAELNKTDNQELTVDHLDMFDVGIGDVIGGRDYITGISIREKITGIIYKWQYGKETKEIKVGE